MKSNAAPSIAEVACYETSEFLVKATVIQSLTHLSSLQRDHADFEGQSDLLDLRHNYSTLVVTSIASSPATAVSFSTQSTGFRSGVTSSKEKR